jgi:hypothetical protein
MKVKVQTTLEPVIFDGEKLEVKWSPKENSYVVLDNGEFVGCIPREQLYYIAVHRDQNV